MKPLHLTFVSRSHPDSVVRRNARFPHGPSALAFALNSCGSILNTTGPALRGLAGR
jgi:hypothetical protein